MPTSDSTATVTRSSWRFAAGTMVSRITGMARDMVMAYTFGATAAVAALMVAFRFSHLLRRVFGEGAMQAALIPHYERLRGEDPAAADKFFRDLTATVTAVLLAAITVAIMVVGGWFVSHGGTSQANLIMYLLLPLLPGLLFICLFGLNQSRLHCEGHYLLPSIAPIAFNLCWIAGVVSFARWDETAALWGVASSITLGCMAQWLMTVRRRPKLEGFPRPFSPAVRKLAKPLLLGVLGVAASQINSALDALFAVAASKEGPALLWYAIRLQQLPLALFGVAASSALLPPLSRAANSGDTTQFNNLLRHTLWRVVAVMAVSSCVLWVAAEPVIQLLFGHGEFDKLAVTATASCVRGYTLGLIPMALVLVLAPAFYSRQKHSVVTRAALVAITFNVVLNTLFVFGWQLGPASIAYATSAAAWVNAGILCWKGR